MQKGGAYHKELNNFYESKKLENSHFHGIPKKPQTQIKWFVYINIK